MKIALITDLHVGEPFDHPMKIDLRKNFTDCLLALRKYDYEMLIIGGDLCLKAADKSIYQWLKSHLDKLDKPYHIIAGNHDNHQLLHEVFPQLRLSEEEEIYYTLDNHGETLIMLDTARAKMSTQQKEWLQAKISTSHNDRIFIFMHHPPTMMNVPFMDSKHSLEDGDACMKILQDCGKRVHIYCGHYHVHKSAQIGNISIDITPSLYAQIDQYELDFAVDHKQIGFRVIDIDGTHIYSTVHYLPGNLQ